MIEYEVTYVDKEGDYQDYAITSIDVRTAMSNLFKLCPDARRIISCKPKSMLED